MSLWPHPRSQQSLAVSETARGDALCFVPVTITVDGMWSVYEAIARDIPFWYLRVSEGKEMCLAIEQKYLQSVVLYRQPGCLQNHDSVSYQITMSS